MKNKFNNMRNFLHIYFDMDYDLFGANVDEIVHCYVYDDFFQSIEKVIEEFKIYLKNHADDVDDVFFGKTFDFSYMYKKYYINSVEFFRNILGKLIFYRDQRLREEAAKKDA